MRVFVHPDAAMGVAFSPDGRYILTGCLDKVARLWDTDYQTSIDAGADRVLHDFTELKREEYGINDQQPTCPSKE